MIRFSPEPLLLPSRSGFGTLAGAVVAVLIVGCAGGAGGMSVQEAFQTPEPLESRCSLSSDERVPTVDLAVDANAVARWAEAWQPAQGEGPEESASIVLSIQRSESRVEGHGPWVRAMASELDGMTTEELRVEVERTLPPVPEGEAPPSYRLRIDLASEPSFHVAPSVHCLPEVANRDRVFEQLADIPRDVFARGGGRAVVLFLVSDDVGTEVYELEESTGNPDLDRAILRIARTARFEPGQVDGFTLETLNRIPFNVTPGR